jgi:hypothetical protein
MNWLREVARRLRMLVHRRQFDADLEEEMQLIWSCDSRNISSRA